MAMRPQHILFLFFLSVCLLPDLRANGADFSAIFPPDMGSEGQKDKKVRDIPPPRLNGNLEWEGSISNQAERLVTVISDRKEWEALWSRAFDKPAPDVDFEKNAVACVFLGFHAGWLYDIHIDDPREKGSLLVVPYGLSEIVLRLSGPFRASGQYRMKAVRKKPGFGMILEPDGGGSR